MKKYKLYNNSLDLYFDEEKHHFYLDPEKKKKVPYSVTGITGIIDKSAPFIYWATNLMGEYLKEKIDQKIPIDKGMIDRAKREFRKVRQDAADVGTEIHEWCHRWIAGEKPEIPEDDMRVINGITAFLKFQKENKLKWLESEKPIYSKKYGYAGILDALAKDKNGKIILVDFKSSKSIYPEMFLQVAGYQIAHEEETGQKVDKNIIIRFGKSDGKFEVKEARNEKGDKQAFLSALNLQEELSKIKKWMSKK